MIVPRYYENLNMLHDNTEPARAYYIPSSNRLKDPAEHREESDRMQLLNGNWKFRYFESIYQVQDAFYLEGYDTQTYAIHSHLIRHTSHRISHAEPMCMILSTRKCGTRQGCF